jgi:hypothetical protein
LRRPWAAELRVSLHSGAQMVPGQGVGAPVVLRSRIRRLWSRVPTHRVGGVEGPVFKLEVWKIKF